jgi:DNA-binding transcriptional MerR regulator
MITITEVTKIVGLSRRVIQEYEGAEVAIKPTQRNKYGYLMYDDACVNRLWQIRFYRELGYGKAAIKAIFDNPNYDHAVALDAQIEMLEKKKQEIENLIGVAQLMKETGITPQSMQPRSLASSATFNDTFAVLGVLARQMNLAENSEVFSEMSITDDQVDLVFEAFEGILSLYREGLQHDSPTVQEAVRMFHYAARPVLSDSVSGLFLAAYFIAPGSEGAKALEEEYQLSGVAEFLQLAIVKYCEDNIDSGSDKTINDLLGEIVSLGKKEFKVDSPEVQAVVNRLFEFYKTGIGVSYLSPMDMMKYNISYYGDSGVIPVIDKLFNGKGGSKYIAAALRHYCEVYEENL